METILNNPGFLHLVEHIFGYLDRETIEVCRRVSNHWNGLLERLSLVKYLLEFGDKKIEEECELDIQNSSLENQHEVKVEDIILGWKEAAIFFAKTATNEDLEEVKESIECLAKDKCYSYPLHYAAENGDLKLMQFFIHTESEFNQVMPGFGTPFHFACMNDHVEMVKLMILSSREFGIDLNARNATGSTPFRAAALTGKIQVVKLMIQFSTEFDIDLNAGSGHGRTLFHDVVYYGDVEMVKLLIESAKDFGISLNCQDYSGATPFLDVYEFIDKQDILKLNQSLNPC